MPGGRVPLLVVVVVVRLVVMAVALPEEVTRGLFSGPQWR